jgi:hypothetical protein
MRALVYTAPPRLLLVSLLALLPIFGCKSNTFSDHSSAAQIEVDAKDITGSISPYFFGQFIEHEHNTALRGLMLFLPIQ